MDPAFGVQPGAVVLDAEVVVAGGRVGEQMPADHEDGAGDRDLGFEYPAAFDKARADVPPPATSTGIATANRNSPGPHTAQSHPTGG